jgi:hypothetical protein
MAGERLKAVMSDMAETIRRVFQAPPSKPVPVAFGMPVSARIPPVEVLVLEPPRAFEPVLQTEPCLSACTLVAAPMALVPVVRGDPGWSGWSTGATVCELPLFRAEKCQRLLVPPLPRWAVPLRVPVEAQATRSRSGWEAFSQPSIRTYRPEWSSVKSFGALERALALPVAVTGEDWKKLPKGLWMRYTLQLVRSTGQNIRNLEVLGLYRIPSKGTRQVRHDPATGRLLVTLGPEAAGARNAPFILARQKDDNSVVCCFVEEA